MQTLNMKLRGLQTHPNSLSEVEQGALVVANNVVTDKEGIVETRRGLKRYGNAFTLGAGEKFNRFFNYDDALLVHYGSKLAYDSNGAGAWIDYSGTFSPPTGARTIKGLEANDNFYFTTSAGLKKIDSLTGTPSDAGGIKALDGSAALSSAGSGFFTTANQVAYRIVWGIEDANGNLILGSPSQRIVIANTSGSSDTVALTFTIPAGITTSHFYQIYRSLLSGGATTEPNDEMGLVVEDFPSAGEITAKSVTLTDSTPQNLRGATLYTSPSQQGILQANEAPPLCKDVAFFKDVAMYANTKSKQRLTITLISVAGAVGVQANDTVTIAGTTYTAKGSENASVGEFKVFSGGTVAENIDDTAQSLVKVINQYATNTTVYAYYISGYNDLPGKILIEERSIGGASFSAIGSNGGAFNPTLPTSGTDISSDSDESTNRVAIAKSGQPEAVPLLNYLSVGSANKAILRILALRDSVFVFKEEGVFRITGEDISNFRVSLFDGTVVLTAPESAVPFNNQIYCYSSQGAVAVSDTGVQIISRPVEVDFLPIAGFSAFSSYTTGVAYNSDRKYILLTQKQNADEYPKLLHVYNSISESWTRWVRNFTCGIVNTADDKLYFGSADSAYVYQERKSFTTADYADEEVPVTIVSSSGTTVTVNSTANISDNWTLIKGSKKSVITDVVNGTTLTVEDSISWGPGSATVYNPIRAEVETVPLSGGNPGILKHYREATVFFRRASFDQITVGFKSNISAYIESQEVVPVVDGAWGSFAFGQFAWGGNNPDVRAVRTYVSRNKQRAHWISMNISRAVARDYFAIAGISLQMEPMSSRFK